MSISLQTNIDSLIGQQNLDATEAFQSTTIQQLTSGYRINSAADDAAGLAVANGFRSSEAELTQGVQNANNATSTLQIADGGMNNISQMLDTLRSLSTESASGTFTGDRTILNNEFQSLLTEVNQQSQAVGLNQGGQFATDLSVYIGGGKDTTTGGFSASNGTLNINLSAATVDTQSLGLTGFQAVGGTTDLSAASASSVSNITGNAANTTAASGYTEFDFSGPGFSDGSQAKVSVNLQGVTDINTLVTALNSAISTTGGGSSASDTAFQSAGIIASVHTDASGGQELAFTSSNTAFQVQAGDQMANALLGNISSGSTGTSIASTVTGGATLAGSTTIASPTAVAFQISGGGMTSPVTLNLGSASTTEATASADIISQVANNTALQAAGITVSQGATSLSPLVFTDSKGDKMNVQVTGDTANALGFGSFAAGATTTAADYSTITGSGFASATATGTAALQFSFNGGASTGNTIVGGIDLAGGDATAATATGSVVANATDAHGTALTISIDGAVATTYTLAAGSTTIAQAAADINGSTLNTLVTASVASSGALVLTAVGKGGHSLTVAGAAATTFGINGTTSGTARSAQSIADAINTGISANASLQAAGLQATVVTGQLKIASSNGTEFRVSASGSTAVPGAPSPSTGANIGFGTGFASGYAGATVSADKSTFDDASGVSTSGTVNAQGVLTAALTFGAMQFGSDTQAITVSANSSDGTLESKSITLQNNATAQTGQSVDSAVSYINQELQQTNNPTLQGIVAVKEDVGGAEQINFISSNNSFSVSAGSSPNGNGFSGAGVAGQTVASSTLGTGTTVSIDTQQNALQAVAALAAAVTKLGSAQAAVGTGENQLNYAIGLAQSQITNFTAAESRIRDADVAADAANLTKGQTLQQAGIAALSQANSEPQAVLHLLQ
jgi:flagellin